MKKTIWKFPLRVDDEQIVTMPDNAHILCVQMQADEPHLWALVDPEKPPRERKILISGTGHMREDLDGLVNYIGTFQMYGGGIIFHVFEAVIYGVESAIAAERMGALKPLPTSD